MRKLLFSIGLALGAPAALAHHSFAVHFVDDRTIEVNGTVSAFRFSNPHGVLSFDVKVWDPVNSRFVDVGENQTSPPGPFSQLAGAVSVSGTVVGGQLNTTYAPNGHYRFDTWHPNASVGGGLYDNEPPFMPVDTTLTPDRPFALSAIQITINYRDISSNQIRQVTILQSLVDRTKPPSVTNQSPEE